VTDAADAAIPREEQADRLPEIRNSDSSIRIAIAHA